MGMLLMVDAKRQVNIGIQLRAFRTSCCKDNTDLKCDTSSNTPESDF